MHTPELLESTTPNFRRVAIVDCETTGLFEQDEPIAIAVIVVDVDSKGNATPVATWSGKQYPKVDIHPMAAKVHGLTKASLKGLSFDLMAFEAAIAGVSCYVAHNAAFDARMIGKAAPKIINAEWRCSYRQWAWPPLGNSKLDTVCAHFGIERPNTHDAMSDAEALLQALMRKSGKTDRSMTYLGKLLAKDAYGVKFALDAEKAKGRERVAEGAPLRTIRIQIGSTSLVKPIKSQMTKVKATKSGSNSIVTVVFAIIVLIVAALFF